MACMVTLHSVCCDKGHDVRCGLHKAFHPVQIIIVNYGVVNVINFPTVIKLV